ncbi:hypothetical protein SPRG_15291 [Saprolegnia parasitica CBS 223.65]|uniref:Uncharacterized protein n=1 Tax=Saprolegnia parasitica (strain CBS 223.65) TaxID=695850 RepID=A0A067BRQ7_SAPPC|nr:hypothetical protein SPRG_15291 [Saprolegnia parasitica CBS 223.65]KDO19485.1 hypothetical protein SPRG_15291 [Saprolegnia parasitica CBS 223.65]|eukprot:XP_012209789.1 hypothetical protein SPRG_15291 [Saprolegnia parasitica CBS 223.65]
MAQREMARERARVLAKLKLKYGQKRDEIQSKRRERYFAHKMGLFTRSHQPRLQRLSLAYILN